MIKLLIGVVYLIGWAFTTFLGGWHITRSIEREMRAEGWKEWQADDRSIRENISMSFGMGFFWPISLPGLLIVMLCEMLSKYQREVLPKYQLIPDWAVALIRRKHE